MVIQAKVRNEDIKFIITLLYLLQHRHDIILVCEWMPGDMCELEISIFRMGVDATLPKFLKMVEFSFELYGIEYTSACKIS
jgi:hypothetical protein